MKGSFEEFIQKIPLFETRISDGQFQFRLLPEATPDEWRPMKKILKVWQQGCRRAVLLRFFTHRPGCSSSHGRSNHPRILSAVSA